MKVIFISPCYNASKNLNNLINSVTCQKNKNWELYLIDDLSSDNTVECARELIKKNYDQQINLIVNSNKKFALRNIIEIARKFEATNNIIAVIDGDDELCNENTVDILLNEYQKGMDVVWTAHKWDTNGMNISKPIPTKINPYQWPWSSSHLRTFRSNMLKNISDRNFKDINDKWFERGYDQALMLPLLYLTENRSYINEVCYLYKINSVSVDDRDWCEQKQHSTINFVRSRGFVK
jgi:glycosyltransferase involved in cell wall biosynthesis